MPAGAFGQVQVQAVHLVQGHQVDVPLEPILIIIHPADVQHQAAPGKPRLVLDRHQRDHPCSALDLRLALDGCGQQLPQGLAGVEYAGCRRSVEQHAVGLYPKPIAFVAKPIVLQAGAEDNAVGRFLLGHAVLDLQLQSGRRRQEPGQVPAPGGRRRRRESWLPAPG